MKYVVVLFIFFASTACATVYAWVDSRGVRHYANHEYDIPERYRSKAKPLYPEQGDTAPAQQNVQAAQVRPQMQPPAPVQLVKPEEVTKTAAPNIVPGSKKVLPDSFVRKGRRGRESAEE